MPRHTFACMNDVNQCFFFFIVFRPGVRLLLFNGILFIYSTETNILHISMIYLLHALYSLQDRENARLTFPEEKYFLHLVHNQV